MKNLRLLIVPCLGMALSVASTAAQAAGPGRFVGSWVGSLKVGAVNLRLVFNINSANGALAATMDSPDQGAKGIPVSGVDVQGDAVVLAVKAAAGSYEGKISPDGRRIDGVWKQGGSSFPVPLQKQDAPFVLDRPQEPKPPFPYAAVEVRFPGMKPGIELAGTLTVPQGDGPFPAVVLVTGSGQQNRDEELMGHRPFAVIADHLTRGGIAVLRYDDRGVGGSKGDVASATTLDFADDAEAAFSFLAARPEVDPRRTGIAGHSEGGLIGPIVAARNPAVTFLVLLAGPGLPGDRIVQSQREAIGRASGMDEKQLAWSTEVNRRLYAVAKGPGDAAAVAAELGRIYVEAIDSNPSLSPAQKEEAKRNPDAALAPLATPWYRTFLALDPAAYLSKVRVPVLALNGSKDLQVPADDNLFAIGAALMAAGNQGGSLRKLDGLNHLFQHAGTGLPEEYGKITETFASEALAAVRDWILGR